MGDMNPIPEEPDQVEHVNGGESVPNFLDILVEYLHYRFTIQQREDHPMSVLKGRFLQTVARNGWGGRDFTFRYNNTIIGTWDTALSLNMVEPVTISVVAGRR